jgi:non-heme chloroperoxidase
MHGDDDQVVPYADSAPLSANHAGRDAEDLPRIPHGMPTTQAPTINADLLAWLTS